MKSYKKWTEQTQNPVDLKEPISAMYKDKIMSFSGSGIRKQKIRTVRAFGWILSSSHALRMTKCLNAPIIDAAVHHIARHAKTILW